MNAEPEYITNTKQKIIHHPSIGKDYRTFALVGKTRSGKTTLVPEILERLATFDNIIIFTPTIDQEVYKHIKKKYTNKMVITCNTLDPDLIKQLEPTLKESEHKHSVIILDDFIDTKALSNMNFLFTRGRQFFCTTIILCQKYHLIPITMRENMSDIIVFRVGNSTLLASALTQDVELSKDQFKEIYKEMLRKPYQWLYFCLEPTCPESLRIRMGWNGILKQ